MGRMGPHWFAWGRMGSHVIASGYMEPRWVAWGRVRLHIVAWGCTGSQMA